MRQNGLKMKIDIGPYPRDLIPASEWLTRYYSKNHRYVFSEKDSLTVRALELLVEAVKPINKLFSRKRKVKIKYHDHDTWNLDYTLALIIAPGLKQLKATNHGFGHVDDDDLPTACLKDASGQERWDWIMDEMIWAFEQHGDEDDTDQYHHNRDQLEMVFADDTGGRIARFNDQKDPNKPPYFRDDEGLKKHDERKANGRRLFAKYYESLWD